jgi:dTDP-4-dehydrorhamnose reductase/dTDP-4-dehydrorhamnose 3,5-epimerase
VTSDLAVARTPIEDLLVVTIPVHEDNRGWFKENWQRAKMRALGLPDFEPVQQNVSFNAERGVARGLHAEPWDKLVSVASGRVFGAWVDLREGPGYGATYACEMGPDVAVFVPRGVANGYQTLAPGTCYSYLVNDHWSAESIQHYSYVNLADPALGVSWPLPLETSEISDADRSHPMLDAVSPVRRPTPVVVGGDGQVGRALRELLPQARFLSRSDLDLGNLPVRADVDWAQHSTLVNAAAFTDVDGAELAEGRAAAWRTNVEGTRELVDIARRHRLTLVHISSDYVFDGTQAVHREDEALSPLGVYGQTKAAADAVVSTYERSFVLRTSWVVGDGKNFVRTMARLARQGVSPEVVDDQYGRPTFTEDIARAARHLVDSRAPYGTYNVSSSGDPTTWAELAAEVFELCGRDRADVVPVSSEKYGSGRSMAPRPQHSTLDLGKIVETGYEPTPWRDGLKRYLDRAPADDQ